MSEYKQLRRMNAKVESFSNGDSILTSYATIVAARIDGQIYLTPEWDSSVSTMRHVRTYFEDYCDCVSFAEPIRRDIRAGMIKVIGPHEILFRSYNSNQEYARFVL